MVAVGYVRVSTEGQVEEGVSLEAQKAKIETWAQLNDHADLELFADAGQSGSSMLQRPGLTAALDLVCACKGVLIVHSLSRLARSTKDTIAISDRLLKANAELVSLSEKIDTTSASGKMVFRMLAVLAEFERDQISERTRAAMAHMRAEGKRVSRFAPYGWDFDKEGSHLVANPVEQRELKYIQKMRKSGMALRQIAHALNQRGVRTKQGSAAGWSAKVVRDLLLRHPID